MYGITIDMIKEANNLPACQGSKYNDTRDTF
jgi:hypothetical protein